MLEFGFQLILLLILLIIIYLLACLVTIFILAKLPRDSLPDVPDWGSIKEFRIPTRRNKTLECWVVHPDNNDQKNDSKITTKKEHAVILLHGWGRNRGRMVSRARIYGRNRYTTILFSARDHGGSDKESGGMSIIRFSQDLEECIKWWGKPVIINGHSIGAGAALLVAAQNNLVKAVIAESSPYAFPYNFQHVYRPALKILTPLFLPGIRLITLYIFRRIHSSYYSPADIAPLIKVPTLIIHGKKDLIFPYESSKLLQSQISLSKVWNPEEGDHFNLELLPDYEQQICQFLNQYQL